MNAVLQPIVDSPLLDDYISRLVRLRDDEQLRRARFVDDAPADRKVEFINGSEIVHSPVSLAHNDVLTRLGTLLSAHVRRHGLGSVGIEKLMVSLTRNDYEPDLCFFSSERAAGFAADQRRFPAPDFIVEILSHSTEDRDRGVKFVDYAAHRVGEYWIVDPDAETVEKYTPVDGEYRLALKLHDGSVTCDAAAGFTIPVRAIFADAENLAALSALLAP